MSKILIFDSSTLIALERADLIKFLNKIDYGIIIPKAVHEEIKNKDTLRPLQTQELKGRTLKLSKSLEHLGIGKGEAQCCALANRLNLNFIMCDDRKFLRQKFFSNNKLVQNIKLLGFASFLHIFYKNGLIKEMWNHFDRIIKLNNWERSEVLVSNYTFLKKSGY